MSMMKTTATKQMMKRQNEYEYINRVLRRLETGKLNLSRIEWCARRVLYAWKHQLITKEELHDLATRIGRLHNETKK